MIGQNMFSILTLLRAGAVSLAVFTPLSHAAAGTAPMAGGVYNMVVTHSGRCMDITSGSKLDGALLQQWGCHASTLWQQFRLSDAGTGRYNIVNANSGLCLEVPGSVKTVGKQLAQRACGQSLANQMWTFSASGTGTYQIRNVNSGLCASVKSASRNSGTAVIQDSCTAVTHKQWALVLLNRTWSSVADGFASLPSFGQEGTTGGAAGSTVTVTTQEALVQYATAPEPYVIRVSGAITIQPKGMEIKVASDKTIIGVGTTGEIVQGGFFLGKGVHNVIIRNLTIRDTYVEGDPDGKCCDFDAIQMDGAHHVWIDHNHLTNMGDGLIDSRLDTTNVTVSWNILSNHNKAFGIGWTQNVVSEHTIHHNWIHDTNQRNPSADNVLHAHLYNNYMQTIGAYGNLSRGATNMVIENSYYDGVNNPYYVESTAAQLVQRGSILVNSPGTRTTNGTAFTPSSFYPYTLDKASDVPTLLRKYAGPQANIE
jgi:pectate lyase